jgi:hypothetical protein
MPAPLLHPITIYGALDITLLASVEAFIPLDLVIGVRLFMGVVAERAIGYPLYLEVLFCLL